MLERAVREIARIWVACVVLMAAFGAGYWLGQAGQRVVFKAVEVQTPCPYLFPCDRATLEHVAKEWHLDGKLICHTEGR